MIRAAMCFTDHPPGFCWQLEFMNCIAAWVSIAPPSCQARESVRKTYRAPSLTPAQLTSSTALDTDDDSISAMNGSTFVRMRPSMPLKWSPG